MKEQAKAMNNFANCVPQVEKKFHGQEDEHEPVSGDGTLEKQNRGHQKYRKHKTHEKKRSGLSKQAYAGFVIKVKKIWDLCNEIGEYKQEKNDYLNPDRFALH
ncbi:MAG TPA: hypothetical protein VJO32_04510 [Ktedonobacteraceae bacterium]|nr:hypothetical protein [Ktedonobacteraceae bacterium]